jgi:dipeptidase E
MCELGWKSLECWSSPRSIDEEHWVPTVRETDVLLVSGGDALYLCHWMRQSGLADLMPSLSETVYVGLSAGSMVTTPRIGQDFVGWNRPPVVTTPRWGSSASRSSRTWTTRCCRTTPWPTQRDGRPASRSAYAIDDDTAITVTDGTVEVVSEGHWKLFSS